MKLDISRRPGNAPLGAKPDLQLPLFYNAPNCCGKTLERSNLEIHWALAKPCFNISGDPGIGSRMIDVPGNVHEPNALLVTRDHPYWIHL